MRSKNNIFIISGPVQIGKTTSLYNFSQENKVGGILSISYENNKRSFYFPSLNSSISMDWEAHYPKESKLEVGKFTFSIDSFKKAINQLKIDSISPEIDWLIIDEIGKLEVESNHGLEPFISEFIANFLSENNSKKLILIIRDSLLQKAIDKYQLQGCVINEGVFMKTYPKLNGLVLAGGESSRMGIDKSTINYHGIPQWEWTEKLLNEFCNKVIVSSNQLKNGISDLPEYAHNGPIGGILTVADEVHGSSILVLGVDYPRMTKASMKMLVDTYKITGRSVFFVNVETDRIEPLIGIYNFNLLSELKKEFSKGQNSLSRIIRKNNVALIRHKKPDELKSFDYPYEQV